MVLVGVFSINNAFAFKTISNDSTGGDCSTIGTWNSATKTCTLSNNLAEGIVIGSNGITLDGNGYTINGDNTGTGILIDTKTIITITNINIENFFTGISLDNAVDVKITKNKITGNVYNGMEASNSNKISIMDNIIENNTYGISLPNSLDNVISGNTISSNSGWGISQGTSIITNNIITNNGYVGAHSGGVRANGDMTNNNISNNKGIGVIVGGKDYKITNNNISNNIDLGLDIRGQNLVVSKNIISSNKVGISSDTYSEFYENTISGNNYAVNGVGIFYHNNFVNDAIAASNGQSTEFFKQPPLGGNYWSDHSPNCQDTNYDNFCDSPYPFSGGTVGVKDSYVWVVQDGWLTKFTTPNSITLDAVDSSGTPYQFTVSATSEGNSLSVTCNPLSGSVFPIGKTDVICTAENGVHGKFTVTVNPLKPIITVNSPSNDPNSTIEGNNPELKIMVTGNIQNKISGKDSIKVTFKDPKGFVVYDTNLKLDAQGYFNNEFDSPLFVKNMRDSGKYSVKFVYDVIMSEFNFNYKSSVYTTPSIPTKDTDGDGISDSIDQCLTQKETINNYQDSDGCPD